MKSKRTRVWHTVLLFAGCLLASCQSAPVCPPPTGTPVFLEYPPPTAQPTDGPGEAAQPIAVEIGRRSILVDQIVSGPLCNGTWGGTVYVMCDVQVLPWEDQPTFLEGCDLTIEPDTVVYVAYHNNTPYYNGCSCHTTEGGQP